MAEKKKNKGGRPSKKQLAAKARREAQYTRALDTTGGAKWDRITGGENPGDNRRFIQHNLQLADLGSQSYDIRNPDELADRITDYFRLCAENDMKPSLAGMALALDVHRDTIRKYVVGSIKLPSDSRHILARAYNLLNAQIEDYMQGGKVNPVAGIFLMKNNFGYEDVNRLQVSTSDVREDNSDPETLRKKYMDSVEVIETEGTVLDDE